MNQKYEFVPGDEKVIAPGRTATRIRALAAIVVWASLICLAVWLGVEYFK